ncbi:MAG: RodZ domain-containing protein [Halieaceae bacterium]|jgi:cytoskeleton protein RodZ|nr:RodZ domain-containing protein [Halieaceae bacterium]
MENSETPASPEVTPGTRLREAREALGMSPREMADRLNWLPAHVAAIEADNYEELRGAAFVRGYLRAYARAVSLDEDEMVALFATLYPESAESSAQPATAPPTSAPSQKTGMSVVLGVAVAVVVIVAIWWKQQRTDQPQAPASTVSTPAQTDAASRQAPERERGELAAEKTAAAAVSSEPAAGDIDASPENSDSIAEETAEAAAAGDPAPESAATPEDAATPESTVTTDPAAAPEPVEPSPEPAQPPADPGAVAAADGPLQFSFSGDCWLEVRDGEGQLIYADLRRAGDTLGLDGIPPFDILAGDAAAVTLRYQGELVPLRTRPGRDTARLTIGEP